MSSTSAPAKSLAPISRAACIGGGVIGGGWIARFLLAGVDVNVFDPHPEAERVVGEVIANAERAYGLLTNAPLPARGRLTFSPSLRRRCVRRRMGAGERARASRPQAQRARRDRRRLPGRRADRLLDVRPSAHGTPGGPQPIRSGCSLLTLTIRSTSSLWSRSSAARRRPARPSIALAPFLTLSA